MRFSRFLLAVPGSILLAGCASSEVSVWGVNDALAYGSPDDASYTQGLQVTVQPLDPFEPCDQGGRRGDDCDGTRPAKRFLNWLNFLEAPAADDDDRERQQIRLEYSVGQQFYTPNDLGIAAVQPDDRPYAGWLYGGLRINNDRSRVSDLDVDWLEDRRRSVTLKLGVVGPASGAEAVQKWWHREVCKCTYPRGWHQQIANEVGFVLAASQEDRVFFRELGDRWHLDVLTRSEASIGNVYTGLDLGATLRAGFNLPRSFSSATNSPRNFMGPAASAESQVLSVYGFAGLVGRAVIRDISLDGTLFRDSIHTVDKEPLVIEGQVGVGLSYRKWSVRIMYARRSDEFETQSHTNRFGAVTVTYTPQN